MNVYILYLNSKGEENIVEVVDMFQKDFGPLKFILLDKVVNSEYFQYHRFLDKISLEKEIKRLEKEKDYYVSMFGSLTLKHYIANGNLHKAFLSTEIIEETKEKYLEIEKKLKSLNRQLKKT